VIPGLLRLASRIICLIIIASFVIFAVNQTGNASKGQQREVSSGSSQGGSSAPESKHEDTVHKTLDEISDELTSPFAGLTSGLTSQWLIRSIKLLLSLLVYGFGLGFIARLVSVRT
jgi:hypothetical protein